MTRVGDLVHLFLCWPGMVPYQRQLFIVVSDWGSYLGSHFPTGFCGILLMPVSSTERHILLLFIVFVSFNLLNMWNAMYTAPWSEYDYHDNRDTYMDGTFYFMGW